MEITIKIDSQFIDALNNLSHSLNNLSASGNCMSELVERGIDVSEKDIANTQEQDKDHETEKETVAESSPDQNVPDVVELRAKAKEVSKTPESKKKIKALLNEFSSKSISDVPESKRAEFLKRLGEI